MLKSNDKGQVDSFEVNFISSSKIRNEKIQSVVTMSRQKCKMQLHVFMNINPYSLGHHEH